MKVVYVVLVIYGCTLTLGVVPGGRNKNRGKGSMWWGIAKAGEPNNISPISPVIHQYNLPDHATLRKKQHRLARENPGLLVAINKGANQAIHECQYQFRNQRWNCSTKNFLRGKNLFGKIVDRGCRETAFIYAITSAAVTHAIARACSEGTIDTCNCETHYKPRTTHHYSDNAVAATGVRDFKWGGCSDNIGFGFAVSREFVDTGERGKTLREKMNLHNNEAGRWHVQQQMRQECKCHGMSGSCAIRTCWMRLPPFRVIGDILKDRFDGASHVTSANSHNRNNKLHNRGLTNNPKFNGISRNSIYSKRENRRKHKYSFQLKPFNPEHKPPGVQDLVYYEMSPPFCERKPQFGIQGTHGRVCNAHSIGVDGCAIMCCGRGYRTHEKIVAERCNCTFHWCCEVKCEICRTRKIINTCV
ncbi:hypothetical protein WA026_000828 [Henosepilachna vigintioctopunctata]|uniref:Protein Wnt n=2 Tax=Henosepilachna vigintioctopunctata TaxID=420089 RepID=A0AAW1V0J3_9CUCU